MRKGKRDIYEKEQRKIELLTKLIPTKAKYTAFKLNDVIYKIGSYLVIQEKKSKTSIGKLLRIIPHYGIKKYYWPSIKVQWLYSKYEINREKNGLTSNDLFDSLSEYELFLSKHTDIVLIETVLSQCYVLSFHDYISMKSASEKTFFTRANYDYIKELLTPSVNSWNTICICKRVSNPDKMTIICDGCNESFHPKCFELDDEAAVDIDKFYCYKCKEEKSIPNNDSPTNELK